MKKCNYFNRIGVAQKAALAITLPFQMLPVADGDTQPENIEVSDISCLCVRFAGVGETGIGKPIETSGATRYELSGSAITVHVAPIAEKGEAAIIIDGKYGQVNLHAKIVLNVGAGTETITTVSPYVFYAIAAGGGGADYKTDVYMDGVGRVIVERMEDGSTVILDEHENPIAKREANGTTKFFDAYKGERFTIDANGNIHFAEFGALSTQVASNTQAIQGIAATGGASVASSVLFNDGENAEVKVEKLSSEFGKFKPIQEEVESIWVDGIATYTFQSEKQSNIQLKDKIILEKDGDSIEFTKGDVLSKGDAVYSFAKCSNSVYSHFAIGMTKSMTYFRSEDDTWIVGTTDYNMDSNKGDVVKLSYENGNIIYYVNGVAKKTFVGQKRISIDSFGDGANYGLFWSGTFSNLKINGIEYDLTEKGVVNYVDVYWEGRSRSFLHPNEESELKNSSPKLMVEKTETKMTIFVNVAGTRKYIAYPLIHRTLPFSSGSYPSFYDNWGVKDVYIATYDGIDMHEEIRLFDDGEAELAINIESGTSAENKYVGGHHHGFENIIVGSDGREFAILIDNKKIDENANVPLTQVSEIIVKQNTELCQAYTNTNPFAKSSKTWLFTKEGLTFKNDVEITRSLPIQNAQMGMFCVFRRQDGNTSKPYVTNKAIKDNKPFKVHDTSDGWDSSYYGELMNPDYRCKKIIEYGEMGIGFSMEVSDDNVVPYKGGMFVATNNGKYNKMYYQNCGLGHTPNIGDILRATITWKIFGQ